MKKTEIKAKHKGKNIFGKSWLSEVFREEKENHNLAIFYRPGVAGAVL